MRIAVVIGSTRRGRRGDQIGHWIARHAAASEAAVSAGAQFEVLDLADFRLPLFDSEVHPAMANKQYDDEAAQAWSDAVDAYDAYIFVTPEYNHSVPAPMKNAFDTLFQEWAHKPVAFASYGAGGGIRAAEHWRPIVANAHMLDARAQITVFLDTDFVGEVFTPHPQLETNLNGLVAEISALIRASKTLRVTA